MPTLLKERLVTKPRETSGSSSANRFDYQRDWALCHLFELHESGQDYVLVMEYHDDVLVLNSATDPTHVDTFQVKTKSSGRWTLKDLLARKKLSSGKGASILGKMYGNCLVLGSETRSVIFVSNTPFSVTLGCEEESDGRERVCLNELDADSVTKVNAQLKEEHGLADDPPFINLAHLWKTSLSLDDHASHSRGRLVDFVETVRPRAAVAIPTLYRALYEELRRCANYEKKGLDFDGLLANKAITRDRFAQMIAGVPESRSFETVWAQVHIQLTSEGVSFTDIVELKRQCQRYEIERMNRANTVLAAIRDEAARHIEEIRGLGIVATLSGLLEGCAALVSASKIPGAAVYNASYIKAIVLLYCYDY